MCWCGVNGIDKVEILFDYRDMLFGEVFGVYIKEFCLFVCFVFVFDENGKVVYVEYVSEVINYLNYEKLIEVVKVLVK